MADINIDERCKSHSKNFPRGTPSISFHAAQSATVIFQPLPNCFGDVSRISLPPDQTLNVVSDITTSFTPTGCADEDTYDITFGSTEKDLYKKSS